MSEEKVCWVRSKWARSDLNGKTVHFDFPIGKNRWIKGMGIFRVKQHGIDELSITIETEGKALRTAEGNVFQLTQSLADAIQRSRPTDSYDFFLGKGV